MREFTKEKLNEILRKHILWIKSENGGEQANLSSANLRFANLSSANLSFADLSSANLSSANLNFANLNFAEKREINTIISIAGIGSARRMTTFWVEEDIIWCGCFKGTLAEFVKKVNSTYKKEELHGQSYRSAIIFFKSIKKSLGVIK